MSDLFGTRLTPGIAGLALALALAAAPAWAQAGVDMEDGTHSPATAAPAIVAPTAAPAAAIDRRDTIEDGIRFGLRGNDPAQAPPASPATVTAPPEQPATAVPMADLPEPVNLEHPKVLDTARLSANGKIVPLFGIVGQPGEPAEQLESYLASAGATLTCPAQTSTDFVCMLPDGTDVAAVVLVNGAARTRDDAPEAYRAQEADARTARRGMWASLPPPPDVIAHPTVQDTATLVSGYQRFILDGVTGLGQPYAAQLQGYIAANGDRLTCQAQAVPGHYICILDDGTDIAKVALVNGAARVGNDSPDSYRLEQLDALNHRRGFWLTAPASYARANVGPPPPNACCAYVAGDDGGDGVRYVGGEPTAVIGSETVFLILAGAAGWGYYDRNHGWHDAPVGYRSHLERFHPNGQGLRAYRSVGPVGPGFAAAGPGVRIAPGLVAGPVRPGVPLGVARTGVPVGVPVGVPRTATFARPPAATFATHSSVASTFNRPGGGAPPMHTGGFVRPAATMAPAFHPAGIAAVRPVPVVPHAAVAPAGTVFKKH